MDGLLEAIVLDADHDGRPEALGVSVDGALLFQVTDDNVDGVPESWQFDSRAVIGSFTLLDRNRDGKVDLWQLKTGEQEAVIATDHYNGTIDYQKRGIYSERF